MRQSFCRHYPHKKCEIAKRKDTISDALTSLIGNPVKIGDGPAAVTGDENHTRSHCHYWWEDVVSRLIRKSEDLSEMLVMRKLKARVRIKCLVDRKGISQVDFISVWDFLPGS